MAIAFQCYLQTLLTDGQFNLNDQVITGPSLRQVLAARLAAGHEYRE
jgi:hypothetical protein